MQNRHVDDHLPHECDQCGKKFKLEQNLLRHMQNRHGGNDRPHKCDQCGKKFKLRQNLLRHMQNRHGDDDQPHKCDQCDQKFQLKRHLLDHMRGGLHGSRPYKCDECGRAFKVPVHLKNHKLTHRGEKLFTCPICCKGFITKRYLKDHLFLHFRDDTHSRNKGDVSSPVHVPAKDSALDVKCELCLPSWYFPNTEDFICHLAHHYDCGEFCCDICEKHFKTEMCLQQHLDCHSGNTPGNNFECEFCKIRLKSAALLREHVIVYHDCKTACIFKCRLCQSAFSTDRQRIRHISQVHKDVNELNFPCSFCDDIFASEFLLMTHLSAHNKRRSFTCPVCKRRLTRRNIWIYHMMVQHKGERLAAETSKRQGDNNCRSYKCNEFFCTFKSYRQLRCHRQKHKGEHLITCPICDKGVGTNQHLKKHLFIHYRDEPHDVVEQDKNLDQPILNSLLKVKCQLCRPIRYFTSTVEFKRHLAHHFDYGGFCCHICKKHFATEHLLHWHLRPYKCDDCGCAFKRAQQLRLHKRRHTEKRLQIIEECRRLGGSSLPYRQPVATVTNSHKCHQCAKTFEQEAQLTRHVQQVHQDEKPPVCWICNKLFRTTADLEDHERFHSNPKDLEIDNCGNQQANAVDSLKPRISTKRFEYRCCQCNWRFMTYNALQVHIVHIHDGKARYRCSACGRRFVDKVMLLLHFARFHRKSTSTLHECDFCEEGFVSDSQLKQHLRVHMS